MLENISLTRKLYLGLGAIFSLLLLMILVVASSYSALDRANHWNVHTYRVLVETHGLGESLVNMEIGARGFAVIGDERFLQPYTLGRAAFARHWDRAMDLTQDNNPAQQVRLRTLREQYFRWTDLYIEPLLTARRTGRIHSFSLEEIRRLIIRGKPYTDDMRRLLAEINADEDRLLVQRAATYRKHRAWTGALLGLGGTVAVALSVGLSTLLVRSTRLLVRANEALQTEIAERRQANEALERARLEADLTREAAEQARKEAERANTAKSEFLSRMSHELRTPLNSILGFAQLLEMGSLDPSERMSVGHILKGGRHLLDLINEVLDLARIEAGRLHLSPEPVQVSVIINEVLDLVLPLAKQQGIALGALSGEGWNRYVRVDQQRLKQVLLNLLSNGVKYNRVGGKVELSCAEDRPGYLRISVRDTGPGIPPEKRDLLFRPFGRLGAEGSEVEGTGLGLALSKNLMEAMGGEIGVDSRVEEGSAFWIELPIVVGPQEQCGQAEEIPGSAPLQRSTSKILYIEDNLANLRLIEQLLTRLPGVELVSAMQGSLGVDLAQEHKPDLILLDLNLPDLTGKQVLHRLREDARTRSIPVVVLSADATPGQIDRLLSAGAREYLTKPLDVKQFYEILQTLLEDREERKERESRP